MHYRSLSEAVKGWRATAGLTQVQLADALDLDQPFVSNLEKGSRALSVTHLPSFCRALKLTKDEAREAYRLCGVDLEPVIGDAREAV